MKPSKLASIKLMERVERNRAKYVERVMYRTGCERGQAVELLKAAHWVTDAAVELYNKVK